MFRRCQYTERFEAIASVLPDLVTHASHPTFWALSKSSLAGLRDVLGCGEDERAEVDVGGGDEEGGEGGEEAGGLF